MSDIKLNKVGAIAPFEVDALAGYEYVKVRTRRTLDPQRRLRLAVLEDAIDTFLKYGLSRNPNEKILFEEARMWIDSGGREWPFSFLNICEVLGLDPSYIRRGLNENLVRLKRTA